MSEGKDFYTIKEIAELLSVSVSTVHRYIDDGYLHAYRIANRGPYRIKKKEYKRFLKAGQ